MVPPNDPSRVFIGGKFFRLRDQKLFFNGVTYGPFGPPSANGGLPEQERARQDLRLIREMGATALRVYHPPPPWFLDLCGEMGLHLAVSIPWYDLGDFMRSATARREVLTTVRAASARMAAHTQVAVLLVGNEINAQLVRWMGTRHVSEFIEDLVDTARSEAPDTPVGYANYPTTEYLTPDNADFVAFNVYLETPGTFSSYIARLHNLAGDRPLMITEFGVDSRRQGLERQASLLTWQRHAAAELGLAGNIVFAFTDEWYNRDKVVHDWDFGMTTRERETKPAYFALQELAAVTPSQLPPLLPSISVIVCTRNGSRTLEECLRSLGRLNYPNVECIVVDDGSTDRTPEIAAQFPAVLYFRQDAAGLSAARNTGASLATGEILAYTDDDCVVDEDWLLHLARAFADPKVSAAGGPNIPPAAQNLSQACVIAAPGGPAHVLISDNSAEHIPGCNLAVRKSAFSDIGGFNPTFHAAGDDVDFCWRLLDKGHLIYFCPPAFVWHYRRISVRSYLKQQIGYGKAEGLLLEQHSRRFGYLGGAQWRGSVYQGPLLRLLKSRGRIYAGEFGFAPFQAIYASSLSDFGHLTVSFAWVLLALVLALNLGWNAGLGFCGIAMLVITLLTPLGRMRRLVLPAKYDGIKGRCILWFLLLMQPILRGFSRTYWGMKEGNMPSGPLLGLRLARLPRLGFSKRVAEVELWSGAELGREHLLPALCQEMRSSKMKFTLDDGWRDWDVEVYPGMLWTVRLNTVTEYLPNDVRTTRARLSTRATALNLLGNAIVWTALLVFVFLTSRSNALIAAGLFFIWWIFLEMQHRAATTRCAAIILRAGTKLGFKPPARDSRKLPD